MKALMWHEDKQRDLLKFCSTWGLLDKICSNSHRMIRLGFKLQLKVNKTEAAAGFLSASDESSVWFRCEPLAN